MTDRAAIAASVVVTGDEVLGGRVSEVNAAFVARDLAARGVRLERTVIVGDSLDAIAGAITDRLAAGSRLICVTGGLGPTVDDLTMEAVARAVGVRLELRADALEMVRARSRAVRHRMRMSDDELEGARRKQSTLPVGADVLAPVGTAPGCVLASGSAVIVVLPGPPSEAVPMWEQATGHPAVAALLALGDPEPHRILRTWGVIEAELMTALAALPPAAVRQIGTYTRAGEIEVVVPAALAEPVVAAIEGRFAGAVFSADGTTVDEIVAGHLTEHGERLAVAESCTGGGLGGRLTARAGASEWFVGGVIAYDDAVKRRLLDVPAEVIDRFGAVSVECAAAMAAGARAATGAAWGVAITGIAGPGGGTPDKPVGTVCIGVSGAVDDALLVQFWSRDRESIRRRAETAALHRLRLAIQAR